MERISSTSQEIQNIIGSIEEIASQTNLSVSYTHLTTYQMQVDPLGYLLHLYYGEKINSSMDYVLTYADRGFSGNPYAAGMDRTYSLDALPRCV